MDFDRGCSLATNFNESTSQYTLFWVGPLGGALGCGPSSGLPFRHLLGDCGTDQRGTFTRKLKEPLCIHDRSCLEMSEADGVDSGAICKRGFIHLQFAEKPEAPEVERHLGSRILE
ncbi:hypothetical protein V1477_012403 [Vespula maculifrons]|uniref:Uncharacterized protein n=1 Tax=Vespula maculifrons TaxID=7453 RepID=A0ABD2BXE3_VESMC